MSELSSHYKNISNKKKEASLYVKTLGEFTVFVDGEEIKSKKWGRDKTVQLFQFLLTARHRKSLHKEQIINRLWEDAGMKEGDRDFKVALHGISKVIEPERKSRTESKYIVRQGVTYQLNMNSICVDSEMLDEYIVLGNQALGNDQKIATKAFQQATKLYEGTYLPNRLYEDWANTERERIQVLALGAFTNLSELMLDQNPSESIRLAQEIILIDNSWEDAYRIQMQAYNLNGNRPAALKTFDKCSKVLEKEFGIEPLPQTKKVYKEILNA